MAKRLTTIGVSAAVALAGGFLIVPYEGKVVDKQGIHHAYRDTGGVITLCYGQTGKDLYGKTITMKSTATEEECVQLLANTLNKFEKQLDARVKVDYASAYQKAALTSFIYNLGAGNLQSSTLLRKLNAGNHTAACEQLTRWVFDNGVRLRGLERRRNEEMQWCLGKVPYEAEQAYSDLIERQKAISQGTSWANQVIRFIEHKQSE